MINIPQIKKSKHNFAIVLYVYDRNTDVYLMNEFII
jgi:hypothetical protein